MSCCNFDGQGTLDKLNPETQRITEAIYSDWTEAAGGTRVYYPPLMDRSADVRGVAKNLGFDGAAVKKNWVPLVVLGLSLVVGIAITEWAQNKYITK
jgi:hypothetical protein